MKLTKKQIDAIIARTRKELKGTYESICEDFGYFMASGANWAYHAGWTNGGDLVVTVFGKVE